MNPLSSESIALIHEESVRLLSTVGIHFWNSPEAIQILTRAGCTQEDSRVLFPRELVAQAIASIPARDGIRFFSADGKRSVGLGKGQVNFSTIGNAFYVYDSEAKKVRDAEQEDVEKYWILFENLENIDIRVGELILRSWREKAQKETPARCERPEEAVDYLLDFHERKRVTTKPVITSIGRTREQVRLGVLECLAYRDSLDDLVRRPTNVVWINPVSPMQYDDQSEGIVEGARLGIPIMISPEIIGGSTGPITLSGTILQNNVEVLAGVVLAQIVRSGAPVIYGSLSGPMDPRSGDISLGNIEAAMVQAGVVQMADFYGLPSRIAVGNTGARMPGARAITEAALGLFIGASAGANIITTGLLDCTLMLSFEHMLVLDELIGEIRRACAGVRVDAEHLAVETISREGRPGGDFLGSEHTRRHMRGELHVSEFFGRIEESYTDWYEKAAQRARALFGTAQKVSYGEQTMERIKLITSRILKDNNSWRQNTDSWWTPYHYDTPRSAKADGKEG